MFLLSKHSTTHILGRYNRGFFTVEFLIISQEKKTISFNN
jgi:hypothetical protein